VLYIQFNSKLTFENYYLPTQHLQSLFAPPLAQQRQLPLLRLLPKKSQK